ncbi:MAG: hypothetical protein D6800_08675, partial [Candidatus Zixiibacteriota bacterium]
MNTYTEILRNPSFVRLAAILRRLHTPGWRSRHRGVPANALIDAMRTALDPDAFTRAGVLDTITMALYAVADTDQSGALRPTTEDIAWLVHILDGEPDRALAVLWLLLAYSSAPDENVTPEEAAALTGMAASTWRS